MLSLNLKIVKLHSYLLYLLILQWLLFPVILPCQLASKFKVPLLSATSVASRLLPIEKHIYMEVFRTIFFQVFCQKCKVHKVILEHYTEKRQSEFVPMCSCVLNMLYTQYIIINLLHVRGINKIQLHHPSHFKARKRQYMYLL